MRRKLAKKIDKVSFVVLPRLDEYSPKPGRHERRALPQMSQAWLRYVRTRFWLSMALLAGAVFTLPVTYR